MDPKLQADREKALFNPSEEVHRVVLGFISDAVFITDDKGFFTYICPNVKTIFGYDFAEVVGFGEIGALLGKALPDLRTVRKNGEIANVEMDIRDKEGRPHTLLVNVKRVEVEEGTTLYTCRDITERKALEREFAERSERLLEEVTEGRDKLKALARRELEAKERERARLSRELHDETGQYMTALQIMIKLCADSLPKSAKKSREELLEAARLTDMVSQRIRSIAHGLRPPALDTLGIAETLAGLCREVSRQSGVRIDYEHERITGLSGDAAINFYRFLQEALTNAIKHARPRSVSVRFYRGKERVILEVFDDGDGFDLGAAFADGGLGLAGMRERMDFIGGSLEIDSCAGCGTRLIASVPAGGD